MGKVLFMRKGETHTAPAKLLPDGFTKLAYIQSSGTQYIDTGFKPNQSTRVIAVVGADDSDCIFGTADGYGSKMYSFIASSILFSFSSYLPIFNNFVVFSFKLVKFYSYII